MVLSLLFIGAIPTTIGTCEAISVQKKQANEAKRSAKFNLVATCDSDVKEKLKEQVDGKIVVLRNGKVGSISNLESIFNPKLSLYIYSSTSTMPPKIHRFSAAILSAVTTSSILRKSSLRV